MQRVKVNDKLEKGKRPVKSNMYLHTNAYFDEGSTFFAHRSLQQKRGFCTCHRDIRNERWDKH